MKSHFTLNGGVAVACAVAGASTMMMNGNCSAGTFIAADYATNSAYGSGWSAGQNGGYGFGAWSFDSTDSSGAPFQSMSTASALGTAWTLFTTNLPDASGHYSGLANAGRAILEPGGLQVGQTFQATIQNPVNNPGITTYRGFDMLFTGGSDNNPPGENLAALRVQVFDYFNAAMDWKISDAVNVSQAYNTGVSAITTGASGMVVSLTINSTNTYTFSMWPVSNPSSPYFTYSSTLTTNLPITYFNFRNYNNPNPTGDPNDVADNFEISSMTIAGMDLNIQAVGGNAILSWPTNVPGFYVISSPSLGAGAVWTSNTVVPAVINGQNVVTNPIAGTQQYFRLQQ